MLTGVHHHRKQQQQQDVLEEEEEEGEVNRKLERMRAQEDHCEVVR